VKESQRHYLQVLLVWHPVGVPSFLPSSTGGLRFTTTHRLLSRNPPGYLANLELLNSKQRDDLARRIAELLIESSNRMD